MKYLKFLRFLAVTGLIFFVGISYVSAGGKTEGKAAPAAADLIVDDADAEDSMDTSVEHFYVTNKKLDKYYESPMNAAMVESGEIPPLMERIPSEPPVVVPYTAPGNWGGTIRTVEHTYTNFGSITRFMSEWLFTKTIPAFGGVYGNSAESYEITKPDGTEVIVHLRKGVKWSNGVDELTTQDVYYKWFDDMLYAEDKSIPPTTLAHAYVVHGGEVDKLEVIDDYTFKYTLGSPNFEHIYNVFYHWTTPLPSNYLRQFHPDYASDDYTKGKEAADMINDLRNKYRTPLNPDYPSLGPYLIDEFKEGDYLLMKRNPYYWKVDPNGKQLPYADYLRVKYIKSFDIVILNVIAGEFDWWQWVQKQTPELYQGQEQGDYRMPPQGFLPSYQGIVIRYMYASQPELHDNPSKKNGAAMMITNEFQRALAYGVDREAMTSVIATPELVDFIGHPYGYPVLDKDVGVGTLRGEDPRVDAMWEYLEERQTYDLDKANQLLDEQGIPKGADGYRYYSDGSRVEIDVGGFDIYMPQNEAAQMQMEKWERDLGIKFYFHLGTRDANLKTWTQSDEIMMMVEGGVAYNNLTGVPYSFASYYGVGQHGGCLRIWLSTKGAQKSPPPDDRIDVVMQIKELCDQHGQTGDLEKKKELAVQATELILYNDIFSIVTFGRLNDRPRVVHNRMFNVAPGYGGGALADYRMEQWAIKLEEQ